MQEQDKGVLLAECLVSTALPFGWVPCFAAFTANHVDIKVLALHITASG
jgi:hypothetical protein